jgi:hypothetical protein
MHHLFTEFVTKAQMQQMHNDLGVLVAASQQVIIHSLASAPDVVIHQNKNP